MSLPKHLPLDSILDSIADGVFTVDLDWNITYFSAAASRITGIAGSEATGRKCWDVLHSSLCDGSCALQNAIDLDRPISNKSIFILRPDGQEVPVSISAAPLKDADGHLVGGVETFRDLTDIHLMRKEMEGCFGLRDIIGKSPALSRVFSILPQVAASDATVLITGASGTGKELVARAIHEMSPRKEGPFVAVNCGALPETLLESELFGYKAGAFTDAKRDKPGRFALAAGGTLFLDEIADIPGSLQVKLLRVLQERVYEPLGGVEPVRADVRIVAATNRDLGGLVNAGEFRQDLYYRLNVAAINMPSLAERREDIPLLARHFVERFNTLKDKDVAGLSDDVLAVLMRHDFPGNVRELENILEFAFILCSRGFIQLEHLPEYLRPQTQEQHPDHGTGTLEEIKCRAALTTLARNRGRKMQTCRELGISKDTLRRMLARCRDMGLG